MQRILTIGFSAIVAVLMTAVMLVAFAWTAYAFDLVRWIPLIAIWAVILSVVAGAILYFKR